MPSPDAKPSSLSIGIALAAYEPNPQYLAEQLRSIVAQTTDGWKCIIRVDSKLEPLKNQRVLDPYFTDARFVWIENPQRLGHKKNFEAVIQDAAAMGARWIFCCDQDDIWVANKLEIMTSTLASAPPLSLVHSDMKILRTGSKGDSNLEINPGSGYQSLWAIERRGVENSLPHHFLVQNMVTGASAAFDADLTRRFPGIAAAADYHDHWLGLLASCVGKVVAIYEPLVFYRQHGGNVVGAREYRNSWLPADGNKVAAMGRALQSWTKSHQLFNSVVQYDIRLPHWVHIVFGRSPDFGIGLIFLALVHFLGDRKLARESVIRALGKAIWCSRGRR